MSMLQQEPIIQTFFEILGRTNDMFCLRVTELQKNERILVKKHFFLLFKSVSDLHYACYLNEATVEKQIGSLRKQG